MRDDLVIARFRHGPFWNCSYLAGSRAAGTAVLVDPAWDTAAIIARAQDEGLRITAAVITHAHDDHAHGVAEVVAATGAAVLVHEQDAAALARIYRGPVRAVGHDAEWRLGALTARLLHTPGHTPGSQCLLLDGALLTGDTLMIGAPGRPGPEPGAAEVLARSLREVLAPLPDDLLLYPGHDTGPVPVRRLGEERGMERSPWKADGG